MPNNGFNNKGNAAVAIFFILAYIAELIFCNNVGTVKYVLGIPLAFGAVSLLTNTEIPIPSGRFWLATLLQLAATVVFVLIYSANKFA